MRKPLILMTPKSLLRHPLATSSIDELCQGYFQTVIDDNSGNARSNISRLIICSGKVYYDLSEARKARNLNHIAIIRLEQLYPFPDKDIQQTINQYDNLTDIIWCQEEPQNQGAWDQLKHRFQFLADQKLAIQYVGRKVASAPATGYHPLHQQQQTNLVNQALGE
jgi:2-oxoglutarate dehydrogenase E1 component